MENTKLEKASIIETECTGNGSKKTHKKVEIVHTGPTGPRTLRGKNKVRRNATKHGIFSEAILKGRESRSEYQALLAGLTENFQPEGTMEELLVQKLCTLLWRQRRLLRAECAAIESAEIESAESAKIFPFGGKDSLLLPSYVLDRLLRYEANLDRSFDRTLSQLERLQRIRRGQSVPPPVKIDLSH